MAADGKLELPEAVLKKLTVGQRVRLILIVDDESNTDSETAWRQATEEQFLKGYSPADSIYDTL